MSVCVCVLSTVYVIYKCVISIGCCIISYCLPYLLLAAVLSSVFCLQSEEVMKSVTHMKHQQRECMIYGSLAGTFLMISTLSFILGNKNVFPWHVFFVSLQMLSDENGGSVT